MFKHAWIIICLLHFSLRTFSQFDSPRKNIDFDEGWKFHPGNAADAVKDFNYSIANIFSKSGKGDGSAIDVKFNDAGWRNVDLPHDWAVELPFVNSPSFDVMAHGYKPVGGLFPETSIGWYRKHFLVNRNDSGQRFQIQFDGIFRDANIWINGFYVGNNKSGYVGVCYDITDYINFDKENVIVVRVDASQYEGWFYEGAGIYRHTWLNEYNNLHIANNGVFVYTDANKNNAIVNIETNVENNNGIPSSCSISTMITDRDGKIIAHSNEEPISLNIDESRIFKQKIIVPNPRLWSLEDPYLYRIISVIKSNGKIIDSEKKRFGIRSVSITSNGLFLNGKYVKIKGTNNHQDHAGLGSALPDYLQYYRIRLLKEMGANAYRTSHNAPAPELLDACDSLGMLVLDEQRLLNSSPEYIDQFERLIKRDRDHPSVFLWSIGNEEGWIQTNSTGKRISQTLLQKQKQLDPSRLSTYAADVANIYTGVNEVIPVRGFNYRINGVDPYHKDHPLQPIVGTEMGSTVTTRGIYIKDTINAYLPDEDITAPWWANTAEQWWTLASARAWWMGGFVWTGFDYRGEPTPFQWPNISSHFGVMDACGFPKNIYYYYQSWWTDKDVLHISPHWNTPTAQESWNGSTGKAVDVWVNSNADNVELFLNGKSLGKKDMPRDKHLQWTVNYEPGKLEAIAYKKGRRLNTVIETTGKPSEIALTPYKTTMLADGKDAAVVNISVVDKQGREVPDANDLIHFSVTGDAKIIGVGNGDPSSHEQDKYYDVTAQRHLFNGKCQVILQSGKSKSLIKLTATSSSLYKGETTIFSIQPVATSYKNEKNYSSVVVKKSIGKMLGADISFLPQLEDRGVKFSDKGIQKDAIEILKDHGFNYIRLRIFNDPATDSGYSPKKGFCDLAHTLQMAKRLKNLGMKFLLDFHYSDYWADPQQQNIPAAWRGLNFNQLTQALHDYTKKVLLALKAQNTLPDMVQVGNEINHGMVWPDGQIGNLDSLAGLLHAGIVACNEVDPSIIIMLHIALGGQNDESRFFLDNMIERNVLFDVIGESYYPKWHGTPDDLRNNLSDLITHYNKDVIVVEYSQLKNEVNDIVFNLPCDKGKGSCIWEPLSTWESVFDKDGKSNGFLNMYDEISKRYLK